MTVKKTVMVCHATIIQQMILQEDDNSFKHFFLIYLSLINFLSLNKNNSLTIFFKSPIKTQLFDKVHNDNLIKFSAFLYSL